ncbi:MAG: SDR family oxidoreductase [Ilumatobacteraceae bacterium]|nr:SDR family oxidoreductase [Ilumatobacteraceae bacterium]
MVSTSDRPLTGRVAIVTGVSREVGIAAAIVRRFHDAGAVVAATGWPPHDDEQPWDSTLAELPVDVARDDLADPGSPAAIVDRTVSDHGRLDIVVATHARSSNFDLAATTTAELDLCWAVNVRSMVLLAQRFAAVHDPAPADQPPTGRMIWFTSGQARGPMAGELPYAITKGALHQMTASINEALAPARIVANCVNPGPVDTGYADDRLHTAVARRFPDGRWGTPDDTASIVAALVSDDLSWIRGQVIDADGGFRYVE